VAATSLLDILGAFFFFGGLLVFQAVLALQLNKKSNSASKEKLTLMESGLLGVFHELL